MSILVICVHLSGSSPLMFAVVDRTHGDDL
jgi:hypothetical protein